MKDTLTRSARGKYPFRMATTSFIYPDRILPNVRRLAPFFDEIELLLFESDGLPSREEILSVAEVSEKTGVTFNVHLPLDISLGNRDKRVRLKGVDAVRAAFELTVPLNPTAYCLHLELESRPLHHGPPDGWRSRCETSLETILGTGVEPRKICVETLNYPIEWVAGLLTDFDLSLCLDLGHVFVNGFDAKTIYDNFKDRIPMIHLHGVKGNQDHLALDLMNALRTETVGNILAQFSGTVCLEVFAFEALEKSLNELGRWKHGYGF